MCRGWMGVALVAMCWSLSVSAQAQFPTYPSAVGAARMPEPIPCGPASGDGPPMPNLVPGPISPQSAPMGPPNDLSLPHDHSSAFQMENYVRDEGFFLNIGTMALQRNKLGAGDIAVYNARAEGQSIGPVVPLPFVPAPIGTDKALSFNSFTPVMSLGVRGTFGYLWDNQSIEYSSFYIWQNDVTRTVFAPGQLDTLFYNPPLTFVGDGLFRRSDQVQTVFGSSLWNNELNYKRWNVAFQGLELMAGVRFMRQNENLAIITNGTALLQNALGLPAPGPNAAIYDVLSHNNIVAPQVGAEYSLPILSWLSLAGMGKGAWGANFLTTDVSLTRGDGLTAFDTHRSATVFSQVYELGGFADIHIMDRLNLRLGYTSTWILGVAASNDQVDINLGGAQARQAVGGGGLDQIIQSGQLNKLLNVQQRQPHGRVNNNGSIMYFGPQIELQFFF